MTYERGKLYMQKRRRHIFLFLIVALLMFLNGCGADVPYPEETLTEEELKNKFYYNQLNEEEDCLTYKDLYEGLMECAEKIYVHGSSDTPIGDVIDSLLYDFPEIFWCDAETNFTYEVISEWGNEYIIIYPEYTYAKDEVLNKRQEVEAMTQECIEECKLKESEYEKVRYVYEYLIDSVVYKEEVMNDQNIYSALVTKETVCTGYAKGMQYLLEESGAECLTVGGEAINEEGDFEGHAWNIVKCDDEYYYVDATWGDYEAQQEGNPYLIRYDYLCCSSRNLEETHRADKADILPVCDSEELDYYRMNGMFYEEYDRQIILEKMKKSIEKKEEYVTFKFADKATYEKVLKELEEKLLNDALQYQNQYYGLSQSNCSYDYDETLYKINVYWNL